MWVFITRESRVGELTFYYKGKQCGIPFTIGESSMGALPYYKGKEKGGPTVRY